MAWPDLKRQARPGVIGTEAGRFCFFITLILSSVLSFHLSLSSSLPLLRALSLSHSLSFCLFLPLSVVNFKSVFCLLALVHGRSMLQ